MEIKKHDNKIFFSLYKYYNYKLFILYIYIYIYTRVVEGGKRIQHCT